MGSLLVTGEEPAARPGARLGIALSGGGFRAAFFHIGLLARLADLDLLRQVEAISTVSGGSVIGAMYYLKLRNLLQSSEDAAIGPGDYHRLVDELWRGFSAGVEQNLRMRTFSNPWKNWKMYRRDYSRSDRMAELYDRYFYAPVVGEELGPRPALRDVRIQPLGAPQGFKPFATAPEGGTFNDHRRNKVPALLINTTNLGTGHNYRFTATWIGESPSRGRAGRIDLNTRMRRLYLDGRDPIPSKYQVLPLSVAVAASTAVPALFHPLALTDLYEEPGQRGKPPTEWTPQLVDGGVHDNQGVEALIDQQCDHVIISDACGQMPDEREPSNRAWSVLSRSNSIMMDRVREEEYEAGALRAEKGELAQHVFFHLLEGFRQPQLTWKGGRRTPDERSYGGETPYGVDERTQLRLAHVRTDLDSFTEVESQALMTDGYLIAREAIREGAGADPPAHADAAVPDRWEFLAVKPYLEDPEADRLFGRQLEVASRTAFKLLARYPALKWTLVAATAVGFALVLWRLLTPPLADQAFAPATWLAARLPMTYRAFGGLLLAGLLYLALFLAPAEMRRIVKLRNLPRDLAVRLGTVVLGCLAVWLHLCIVDPIFLRQGKVARLRRTGRPDS